MRRFLLTTAFVAFAGPVTAAFAAAADTGPAEFIRALGNEALEVIRTNTTPAQKQAFFHQLLQQNFDVPGKSRFVLGRYWRLASEPEKQEFGRLFEDYIVRVYSARFAQYRGETLRVTGSRSGPEGAIVTSEIVRPEGAPPIRVDGRLSTRDGLYKISDIIINGISMGASERSEFAQAIERSGGQVEGLLAMMRKEATAPQAAAPQGMGSSFPPR